MLLRPGTSMFKKTPASENRASAVSHPLESHRAYVPLTLSNMCHMSAGIALHPLSSQTYFLLMLHFHCAWTSVLTRSAIPIKRARLIYPSELCNGPLAAVRVAHAARPGHW